MLRIVAAGHGYIGGYYTVLLMLHMSDIFQNKKLKDKISAYV